MDKAMDGGWRPLIVVCYFGHLEVVRLLVEKGAGVDEATSNGFTPLYAARRDGHLDVVQLLVVKGG